MRIYSKNNHAKFQPDPIWNDEALCFLKSAPYKNNNKNKYSKISSDMKPVPDPKKTEPYMRDAFVGPSSEQQT